MSNRSIITPVGEFLFAHLDTPSTHFDPDNEKLEITIVLDEKEGTELQERLSAIVDAGIDELQQAERDARKRKKIAASVKYPGVPEEDKDTGEPTGRLRFKFTTKRAPKLFDSSLKELDPTAVKIGNGSTGVVKVGAGRPYYFGQRAGVAFYLNVVQVKTLNAGNGGDTEGLEAFEDGYEDKAGAEGLVAEDY